MNQLSLASGVFAFCFGLFLGETFLFFPLTLSVLVVVFLSIEFGFSQKTIISSPLLFIVGGGLLFFQVTTQFPGSLSLTHYVDRGPLTLRAIVASPPQSRVKYSILLMRDVRILQSGHFSKATGQFRLNISGSDLPFSYGDELEMTVSLRSFRQYNNPGSFLYGDYRRRSGWSGRASLSRKNFPKKVGASGLGVLKVIYDWREQMRILIKSSFDAPVAGLFQALVLGEGHEIDDTTRKIFVDAGMAHLLAVSGTHLSFVALFVFTLSRLVLLYILPASWLLKLSFWKTPSQCATLPSALAAILYAFLAGGRIGTLRALVMILVYLLSIALGRTRSLGNSLALAALLIVSFSPSAIFDLSFQLSFVAVLSISLVGRWWRETATISSEAPPQSFVQSKVLRPLKAAILTSSSAALGTAVLTLFYFHQFSWVGLIANIVLLPIAGLVLIPLALISVLIAFFGGLAVPFAALQTSLWTTFLEVLSFFAQWPGADWHFAAPPLWSVLAFYGVHLVMLLRHTGRKTLLTVSVCFFLLFFVSGVLRLAPDDVRVTIIDVGQGDAALIEFPGGETVLIDGGRRRAGRFALLPFLWQRRIRTIDVMVATHPQHDHVGGLADVLKAFEVKTVVSNGRSHSSETVVRFESALRASGATHLNLSGDEYSISFGDCVLYFFEDRMPPHLDENAHSIVSRLQCTRLEDDGPDFSLLFTGDIGRRRERSLLAGDIDLKSTVLKVAHHGSRYSSHDAFLKEVSPKVALVSAGQQNRYRHPHPDTLRALQKVDAEVYRTDLSGSLVIERNHDQLVISRQRDRALQVVYGKEAPVMQEWANLKHFFSGY